MKAMILAAGRGERMRPLTDKCPKPLLKVDNDYLISWHLRRLKAAGFNDIVINHAWLGYQIEEALGQGTAYGLSITYSPEGKNGLETAGGIANALPLLGNEPFLVINADIFTNIDFHTAFNIAKTLDGHHHLAHLWLVNNPNHHAQGDFGLQKDGLVNSSIEHGIPLTFSGVGVYHPSLFAHIPSNTPEKLAPILRTAMNHQQVTGEHYQGFWIDVGTVDRLAEANQLALSLK